MELDILPYSILIPDEKGNTDIAHVVHAEDPENLYRVQLPSGEIINITVYQDENDDIIWEENDERTERASIIGEQILLRERTREYQEPFRINVGDKQFILQPEHHTREVKYALYYKDTLVGFVQKLEEDDKWELDVTAEKFNVFDQSMIDKIGDAIESHFA